MGGDAYGLAFGYRYGQFATSLRVGCNYLAADGFNNECEYDVWNWTEKDLNQGDFVAERSGRATHSIELNGYWVHVESGWALSVSLGYSRSEITGKGFFGYSPVASQSWFVGLKWDDVFDYGNDLGIAFGQPNFATELEGGISLMIQAIWLSCTPRFR